MIRKIQEAVIDIECDDSSTIGDITTQIEQMSEEEIGFSAPEYHLVAITKEDSKISNLVWRSKSF